MEILLATPAISNLIRESKTFQIPSVLQTSRRIGMVTMHDALVELVDSGKIEPREAYVKSLDKTMMATALKTRGHDVGFAEADHAAERTAGPGAAKDTGVNARTPMPRAGLKR
jgi:twitching motility protein PilT